MQLYSYFRSSASFRVRIALNLKGLPYDTVPIHLVRHGGEQRAAAFLAINPDGLVPVLVDDTDADTDAPSVHLTQSLAIVEYLDETHPQPPLLPPGAAARARVRALALNVACEIHPLDNLRVLRYLKQVLGVDDDAKNAWYRHWVETGLASLETQLATSPQTGTFCHGDRPTLADIVLVPQVFNAERFDCDLSAMPTIRRIHAACNDLEAFAAAAPGRQPDAE